MKNYWLEKSLCRRYAYLDGEFYETPKSIRFENGQITEFKIGSGKITLDDAEYFRKQLFEALDFEQKTFIYKVDL